MSFADLEKVYGTEVWAMGYKQSGPYITRVRLVSLFSAGSQVGFQLVSPHQDRPLSPVLFGIIMDRISGYSWDEECLVLGTLESFLYFLQCGTAAFIRP